MLEYELIGRTRQHHIIRETNVPGVPKVHSLYPYGSKGRIKAEAALKTLPQEKYELDFILPSGLYIKNGSLERHGYPAPHDNKSKTIPDNLPHPVEDINKEAQYLRAFEEKPTTGELIDILRSRRPKSVAEMRSILPPSITNRLGEGEEGLEKTVSMLRNLTTMVVFDRTGGGSHLDERDFAESVASWIYFPDDPYFKNKTPAIPRSTLREDLINRAIVAQQQMLLLALEGGILERHQSWTPPGQTPKPYRLPIAVHRILRRIFRP